MGLFKVLQNIIFLLNSLEKLYLLDNFCMKARVRTLSFLFESLNSDLIPRYGVPSFSFLTYKKGFDPYRRPNNTQSRPVEFVFAIS